MARISLLLALFALTAGQSAMAAKCDFRQDIDDFFNGVPTLRTKWDEIAGTVLGNSDDLASRVTQVLGTVSAVRESGASRLEFKLRFANPSIFLPTQSALDDAFVVPLNAPLEVTLADGTLIELSALEPVTAWTEIVYPYAAGNDDYYTFVYATIPYGLDDKTMSALGAQNASAIRVHGESGYKDVTVPKKGSKHLKEAINCLQQGEAE